MFTAVRNAWALLFGMLLLMIGNGLQGTLLGVRGSIEGFDPALLSYAMSAYFLGFLGGSRLAPRMIRRVGHVRVFAALGSLISAAFVVYAAIPEIWAWVICRLVVGFCFSAVYVVAESWLNDSSTNETRGQTLSAYMIVQLLGIVAAQGLLNVADPAGYDLFILISVLVSVSFAPILLSASPAPVFQTTKPMSFGELYSTSPLAFVATISLGAIFSALFGMAAVYGSERGLSLNEIAIFVSAIYIGGAVAQFPIGYASDRMDRRLLIVGAFAVGAAGAVIGALLGDRFWALMIAAVAIGGTANPLYSLMIAHASDYVENDKMAATSSGIVFLNGVGAIGGPVVVGYAMAVYGASAFFVFIAIVMGATAVYGAYRMTQRPSIAVEDTGTYAPVTLTSSPVAVEIAQDYAVEAALAEEAEAEQAAEAEDAAPARPA